MNTDTITLGFENIDFSRHGGVREFAQAWTQFREEHYTEEGHVKRAGKELVRNTSFNLDALRAILSEETVDHEHLIEAGLLWTGGVSCGVLKRESTQDLFSLWDEWKDLNENTDSYVLKMSILDAVVAEVVDRLQLDEEIDSLKQFGCGLLHPWLEGKLLPEDSFGQYADRSIEGPVRYFMNEARKQLLPNITIHH